MGEREMGGFAIEAWHDFFIAEAGAGAALAGLVFVSISINLQRIMSYPGLPGRALEALTMLLTLLFVGLPGLIPGQSAMALGIELIGLGIAVWAIVLVICIQPASRPDRMTRFQVLQRYLLSQAGALPIVIAGASLVAGWGGGLYWLPASALFCLLSGIVSAWVLLIEILR